MKQKSLKQQLSVSKPSFGLLLGRGLILGWQNLWRNKMLTIATVLVMAVMITIFNSLMAVNFIGQEALQNLNQKIDVVIYLRDDISLYDATYLQEQIAELPGVKNVNYISKEKALETVSKTYPETVDFLQKFSLPNPLPPSLSILTEKAEDHDKVLTMISRSRFKEFVQLDRIQSPRDDQEVLSATARNLININGFVRQLVFWVIFTFMIGSILVVINAVQLTVYARKNEILIMRLVGATPAFIRLPFLMEGFFYAVLAVFLSVIFLWLAVNTMGISNLFWQTGMPRVINVLLAELGITIILNLVCSFVTVQNYLKKHLTFA